MLSLSPPSPRCRDCHHPMRRQSPDGLGPVCRRRRGMQPSLPGVPLPPPVACTGDVGRCGCLLCASERAAVARERAWRAVEGMVDAAVEEKG